MVTVEESQAGQQFSAWNFQDFNQMALLHLEQNCSLPYFPSVPTANHPEQPNHLFGCNTGQPNTSRNQCLKNYQHGLGVSDKPNAAPCAHKKRFLIFDRSGNQTRLFVSPSFSRQNNIISSEVPATASGLWKKVACGVDQQSLVRLVAEEKWDENSLNDGEGDMVEDTEDINALLHSDSDDEYDDDDTNDGKNYELTGTRHTLLGIEDCGNKDKLLEQSLEEVASSDSSPKRQKLLDGSCKKSSLASVERPVKRAPQSSNYKDDDVESHDINLSKNSDMVKIHKAVKILGSIIPGLNSKNPVSIIDKAVAYLETMKMEAKAVGYATLP